jgi:hypothetical protein
MVSFRSVFSIKIDLGVNNPAIFKKPPGRKCGRVVFFVSVLGPYRVLSDNLL